MNSKQLVQELYKYFVLCTSQDKTAYFPKNISHIQNCFEQLIKNLEKDEKKGMNLPKVDGYCSKK